MILFILLHIRYVADSLFMSDAARNPNEVRHSLISRANPHHNCLFNKAQRLYDHIRTIAWLLDASSALLPIPILQEIPVQVGLEPLIAAFVPELDHYSEELQAYTLYCLVCYLELVLIWLGEW
jgi:hypothetical protein